MCSLGSFKQFLNFFSVIIATNIAPFFWTLNFICRVVWDEINFYCVLECFVDVCMVMDNRVCCNSL